MMADNQDIGCWQRIRRFLIDLNFFETDDTDDNIIRIQRWSTRVYICILFLCMCILCIQHILHIENQLVEIKNPSMKTYIKLRQRYPDINCPCSQIPVSYESFVVLNPVYHSVCSSEFISQIWIERLVDQLTSLRFPGDFRAMASTQFQVLRELCRFSQSVLNNQIQSFYHEEFVSGILLSEDQWRTEINALINAFLSNSFTNVQHKISFFRSFVTYNLFGSAIQTPLTLLIDMKDNQLTIVPKRTVFSTDSYHDNCTCDEDSQCRVSSSFYNIDMYDNHGWIADWLLESQLSLVLNDWSVGCWPLESLFLSSLNNSFLNNQTQINIITTYFNWSSNASIPMSLNLQDSTIPNVTDKTLDDLIQTSFVVNMVTELNYSTYFEQCRIQACFYSTNQRSTILYIITALLGLYGGLSVALKLLIPPTIAFLIKRLKCQNATRVENFDRPRRAQQLRVRLFFGYIWKKTIEFNLFKSFIRRDPFDIKQQRWTTRIFIVCFIIGVVVLAFYALLIVEKKSIQVTDLDLDTVMNLQSTIEYNSLFRCPCTQINIPYRNLITLRPTYHQICSSDFVSDRWLEYMHGLFQVNDELTLNKLDFRRSYQLFYLLRNLCDLVEQTFSSSLDKFEQTELVTSYLLSTELFRNQMYAIAENFNSALFSGFVRFFQLAHRIAFINQYYNDANIGPFEINSLFNTSFSIYKYSSSKDNASDTCSCANDIHCKSQFGLYSAEDEEVPKVLVPGMYRACFTLESLLQSTLECFYDKNCLLNITGFYQQTSFPINFVPLDPSQFSRFQPNTPIGSFLSELFLEYWNVFPNYPSYFAACRPISCSYEIIRRNSLLETSSIVLGLVGGWFTFLRIFVVFLVTICVSLMYRRQQDIGPQTPSRPTQILAAFNHIKNWLKQINVFDNPRKTIGINIHEQQRATYVYLLLLTLALCILIMYNSLAYFPEKITILNPSRQQYQQLRQQYHDDILDCPCSQVSLSYSPFWYFECSFHPVCQSQFISDVYLQKLFEIYDQLDRTDGTSNAFTLQGTVFAHFQALRTLCDLVSETYKDARQLFLTAPIIFTSMIDNEVFDDHINSSLNRFKSELPNEFLNSLQFIRGMVQSNAFVSLYSTNWYPVANKWQQYANVYMKPQSYGNCSCLTSSSCTQSSIPFIPGYVVGCTPLEALLRSTIECLYEQECIDLFTSYLNLSSLVLTPIDFNETRFSQDDTLETIIENMFIENCSSNAYYRVFFEQCRPFLCTVTRNKRKSPITIVIILFSLYGGLTVALKLIVPIFVYAFYKILRRFQ